LRQDEFLTLDNHLCFTIYACSREITRLYRPLLEQMGITYPQYLVLIVLLEKGECTVKELGDRLYLDSGTLTPLLKRMEEAGLVTRARSVQDERVVVVRLTEKGRALKTEACEVPRSLMKKSGIPLEDVKRMLTEFQALLHQVHEANRS
jgi:DNA-binding MarR family transcriptional regulator